MMLMVTVYLFAKTVAGFCYLHGYALYLNRSTEELLIVSQGIKDRWSFLRKYLTAFSRYLTSHNLSIVGV